MYDLSLLRLICLFLGLLGGIFFIVYPIVSKYDGPKWVKTAFLFLGIFVIIWAALLIGELGWGSGLERRMIYAVQYFRTVIVGFCCGILLTLTLAGQIRLSKRR